jgi:hypothetical protein
MDVVLRFLEENEVWIYVVAGLAALLTLRWLLKAWQDWRNSVFGLERDIVQRKLAARLTVLVLLGLLILTEFLIVSFVIPANPRMLTLPTATLDILATPTVTLPAGLGSPQTPTPADAGLPTQGAPITEGCTSGQIEWIYPKAGDSLAQSVELKGTVNVPNLGFFKYEYTQSGSDTWTTIAAGNSPLVNGTIGFWNTVQLPAGDYLLRLVVVDNQNTFFPACVVSVRIANP